ncbi:MAG TPA: outer membrane beta-barrel protein [Pseudolabrys sp.]|nr:outer membrane beta-barrel protein [Pseudolabrys sp.]
MGSRPAAQGAPGLYTAGAASNTWTGCYIGANIGGAFGQARVEANDFFGGDITNNGSGFAGGGQIGCDYQWAGGWVIGFRNMFDGTTNKRSRTITDEFGNQIVANFNNQWFDTLTGRLGYAVAPTWLLYFQGGGAWAHTSTNLTFGGDQIGQTSKTRSGWTVGGGVEWMFAPHWSAFLEGNWMDFGTKNFAVDNTVFECVVCTGSVKATEATVLVGVNYRFW